MCVCVHIQTAFTANSQTHVRLTACVYTALSCSLCLALSLSLAASFCMCLSLSLASSPGGNARAMPGLCPILVGTLALMMIETTNVSPQPQPQLPVSATVGAAATPRKTKDARCEMRVACSARQIRDFDFKFVSRGGFKGRLGKRPAARLPRCQSATSRQALGIPFFFSFALFLFGIDSL